METFQALDADAVRKLSARFREIGDKASDAMQFTILCKVADQLDALCDLAIPARGVDR